MPRQKLSEYSAKRIVLERLGVSYAGWPIRQAGRGRDISRWHDEGLFRLGPEDVRYMEDK